MSERVLMKGNEALAEAAIAAGCRLFFGYPITPQNEVVAHMSKRMPQVNGLCLQAESEVAAINMVLGAAATGNRVMTSSSSPGISLKGEGISYIAGSDVPCVIINIQRGGPGLGGIQPSQADYHQATKATGHGDFRVLVYAPSTIQEMIDYTIKAFDKADEYRMPVMILADGMLGQMMEPVALLSDKSTESKKDWALTGHGHKRPKNLVNSLFLQAAVLEEKVKERYKKYDKIKETEAAAECTNTDDAELTIVAYGASARVATSAINMARAEGLKVGLIRPITLWPFPSKIIQEQAKKTKKFMVVEMSMGQMVDDVRLVLGGSTPVEFYGRTGGIIPTPAEVFVKIKEVMGGAK